MNKRLIMPKINKVEISGRITQDITLEALGDKGTHCVKFGVAHPISYKDKQGQWQNKSEFHNVVAWGNVADICASKLAKGYAVIIEGSLTARLWTDKAGNKRKIVEIICLKVHLLETKDENATPSSQQQGDGVSYYDENEEPTFPDEESVPF